MKGRFKDMINLFFDEIIYNIVAIDGALLQLDKFL